MSMIRSRNSYDKISSFIIRFDNVLCFACYVVGLVWFMCLAYPDILNGRTYFSENALLSGVVERQFRHGQQATDYLRHLKDEVKLKKLDSQPRNRMPVSWLIAQFNDIGIDSYIQNYTFHYPHSKQLIKAGHNVYGILRAPRTAGTEALVLSSPYRSEPAKDSSLAGIALLLAMAQEFRENTYWAKDIIFLITEDEMIGMQAWLAAYHQTSNQYINSGELIGKSGSIQAALNIDIGTDKISHIDINIEGLNGQLPNLDLVNTVSQLCRREGVVPTLHMRADYYKLNTMDGFLHSLKTMLLQMMQLASGSPSGNHGVQNHYSIEALTLHGVKQKGTKLLFGYREMGRIVEGVFRSLNNLLERFHQSFFFYLLPSVGQYASIGVYMPPFGILALPVVIKGLSLWLASHRSMCQLASDFDTDRDGSTGSELQNSERTSLKSDEHQQSQTYKDPLNIFGHFLCCSNCVLMSMVFGISAYYGGSVLIEVAQYFHFSASVGLVAGFLLLHLIAMLVPFLPAWKLIAFQSKEESDRLIHLTNVQLLKSVALLIFGVLLGTTAVLNISLAIFVATVSIPVIISFEPIHNRFLKMMKCVLLLSVSPFTVSCVLVVMHAVFMKQVTTDTEVHVLFKVIRSAFMSSWLQLNLIDNWIYGLVTLAYFPCWVMLWFISAH